MSDTTPRERLQHLKRLLRIEQEEDLRLYHEQVLRRSLKERCDSGVAWFPLAIQRVSYGLGGRVVVDVERTTHLNKHHLLASGSQVLMFGMVDDKAVGDGTGVVYHVHENKMRIVLASENVPAWLYASRVGVNLSFDDKTYKDMNAALGRVIDAKNDRLSELRELLMGNAVPRFRKWDYAYTHPRLNASQQVAVQRALEAEDVAVIHGPPGTGKTTTLVQAINETVKRERQVLVCAASNNAVDLLTLKCAEEGLIVVRIGNPARVEEILHIHTLDVAVQRHEDYDNLRKMRREAEDARKNAEKWKRSFTEEARRKRGELHREASELSRMASTLEDYIIYQTLQRAQVISTTLTGVGARALEGRKFTTLFIDEAAQALTPACWIAIARAERVIFAGDHRQLPPTVKAIQADREGLGKTLFEESQAKPHVSVMLNEQYRMHEQIMQFSSDRFYGGGLTAAPHVRLWTLGEGHAPVEFVDTAGCGYEERSDSETLSSYNPEEAHLLLRHLAKLLNKLEEPAGYFAQGEDGAARDAEMPAPRRLSIGLISPYKSQVKTLREQFYSSPMLTTYKDLVTINTVDGFQGQERDIIYISLTRSNKRGEIGFLQDVRRMNVALTRARKKLVVVGDSATLAKNPFYAAFLDYIDRIDAYHTAWEWME